MTALLQMAAARPPGIADARVPCPLCDGLIHPVAGRCKHCKEDLSSFRAGRPQAAAALPALNGKPKNGESGHAAVTAIPVIVPSHEASQPILPPRTTSRSLPVQRTHSVWRSWPMLVIVLAVIAIVAATVIMIMPPDTKSHGGKMSPPPAPDRMQTNPIPEKSSQIDPWDNGLGNVPRTPDPVPPPPGQPDPDDDDDVFGGVIGGTPGGAFGTAGANFMITALDHACAKLKSCPDVDQSTLTSVCEAVAMMPKAPAATNCPSAQRCLDSIDRLSCTSAQTASPHSVFTMFNECMQATQC